MLACCANVFLSSSFLSCLFASLSSAISLSLTNFCTFCQPSSSVSSVNQVYLEEGVVCMGRGCGRGVVWRCGVHGEGAVWVGEGCGVGVDRVTN